MIKYKQAIENAGLIARRADDISPGTIVEDIWEFTQETKIILTNLTGKNANVFYELGLADAIDKPVILVANSMDDVP
ncbi:MAG: hypothetical protein AAF489_09605 [Bacteroidota bacterium]